MKFWHCKPSADYQQGLQMTFDSKEAAITFAERQGNCLYCAQREQGWLKRKGIGWDYYVHEPVAKKFVKKEYADNFKYSPGPLRVILTR